MGRYDCLWAEQPLALDPGVVRAALGVPPDDEELPVDRIKVPATLPLLDRRPEYGASLPGVDFLDNFRSGPHRSVEHNLHHINMLDRRRSCRYCTGAQP